MQLKITLCVYSLLWLVLSFFQCYTPEPLNNKRGKISFPRAKLDRKLAMTITSSFLSKSKLEPRNQRKPHFVTLLYISAFALLSGDLHPNPGLRTSCSPCGYAVGAHHPALQCDECNYWHNINCIPVTDDIYEQLKATSVYWFCPTCSITSWSSKL